MTHTIQCLVSIKEFGSTIFANVCIQPVPSISVPWTFYEWVQGVIVFGACLIVVGAIVLLGWNIIAGILYERKRKVEKAPGMQE